MYYLVTNRKTEEEVQFYSLEEVREFLDMQQDSDDYNVEKVIPCRGCNSPDTNEQHDAYGISTGYWCDECYEHNYPYRKDRYHDYLDAGEYLDDDY
jgi:hypothetical protein